MSSGTGRRVRLAATERRDQLLAAAAVHIDTYGLEFSLDDVARRAGISPPLMRHYFKNRDGLLVALLAQGIDAIMAILAGAAGGDLRARLGAYLSYVRQRPWAHRLWRAAVLDDDSLAPLVRDARDRLVEASFRADGAAIDDAQRFLGEAWIAVVESSVDRWLAAGATDRDGLVTALLEVARRLGVPRA